MSTARRFVLRVWIVGLVASTLSVGLLSPSAAADEFSVEDTLTFQTADESIDVNTRRFSNWNDGPGQYLFDALMITRDWNGRPGFAVDSSAFGTQLCLDLFADEFAIECELPFFELDSRYPTIPEAVDAFVTVYNTFLADNGRGEQMMTAVGDETMTISYLVPRTDGTMIVNTEFFGAESPVSSPVNLQIDGVTVGGATDVQNGGTTGAIVVSASTHTATQSAGTGTDLADFTTTYSCTEDTNLASPIDGSGLTTAAIEVAAGDDWVCTFTNTKNPPVLCGGAVVTVDLSEGETPTEGDDVIRGTSGPDIINALGGNDIICSLQGDDTINAGDGFDQVFAGDGADSVAGGIGNDKLVGGSGNDEILGERGNDRIQGGAGADELDGGSGSDRIAGGTGNDVLRGGTFADELLGGLGRDQLFGDEGDDVLRGGAWIDVMNGGPQNDGCTLTDPSGLVETRVSCETGVFGR